jgi:phosphoserine phosphatase RsbU/P
LAHNPEVGDVPTEELAGDSIGLHLIDDRYLVSYILDVSGHGVPAALLAVSAMHALDPMSGSASLLRDMTGSGELGTVQRPARVATELNRRFMTHENDDRFMTMILCVLDTYTGRLHLSSAGHPPPLILRDGTAVAVPEVGGLPIAIMEGAEYIEAVVQLVAGDRVFLYSDGLVEQARPSSSEQFGDERALSLLQARHATVPEILVKEVVAALTDWSEGTPFADDVSIAVFQWIG